MLDYCPDCGSDDLDEFMSGDVICNDCGHIHNVDEEE